MSKKQSLLICNDDGYGAPGLLALIAALSDEFLPLVVVPDRDRSGSGQSLTLHRPIKVKRYSEHEIAVEGTPADCVNLGLSGLFDHSPAMVVSGINSGANLGNDVLYSGTVAGAMEGVCSRLPAIAFSLVGNRHFDTAAFWAEKIVKRMIQVTFPPDIMLNINIPDRPLNNIKGVLVTSLGRRRPDKNLFRVADPRGQERYWIGLPGEPEKAEEGIDFWAVKHDYVSITPLSFDRCSVAAIESIASIFEGCE